MPLKQVIDAAKKKKSEMRHGAFCLENKRSPTRTKSNDTARLSFSMADEVVEEKENELFSAITSTGAKQADTDLNKNRAVVLSSIKTKTISQVCKQNLNKQAQIVLRPNKKLYSSHTAANAAQRKEEKSPQ